MRRKILFFLFFLFLRLAGAAEHPFDYDLYGFSAGGGALINAIAVLNGVAYDSALKKIGIEVEEKKDSFLLFNKELLF